MSDQRVGSEPFSLIRAPVVYLPPLKGEPYIEVLRRWHAALSPATYFEIGLNRGESLALANGKVIGIDPNLADLSNVFPGKTACHLFQMTSDRFFRDHDPRAILGAEVDMAFLDGLHLFEFLLRDFINIEASCRPNSIVALHDCLPVDIHIASRRDDPTHRKEHSTQPGWWAGDVWKIVPVLRKYRPDIKILTLDASPTGLVFLTNLDPSSRLLRSEYFNICDEFSHIELVEYGLDRLFEEADIRSTSEFSSFHDIARFFWL